MCRRWLLRELKKYFCALKISLEDVTTQDKFL